MLLVRHLVSLSLFLILFKSCDHVSRTIPPKLSLINDRMRSK